ncbi:hypothetical protein PR202_gb02130 [Eleusine coracana subsp. coracana]|uniref:Uncharacterized protein n=1 Tax=Eleusine coracana subsp. coracana TaxID=191504 RepID=A0AAV5DZC7_ELECO|nr:hypothetical protein QOZ80_5BG0411120 [Eleusine coracana subsp. coracana]GJN15235.1 hypothetical protein PR202_gb02130 [Eleusine coracana subsp. coracana]
MAIETVSAAAAEREISETAPMSPPDAKAAAGPARPRRWLRRLVPREYLPRSRRWKPTGGAPSRLASSLSRSLRWKRLPGFSSLSLKSGSASASAVVDAVTFRVMYVVEAVVLGLGLSCFFLCCGCHL